MVFEAAAAACGCALLGAWVVGDSSESDVGGAVSLGLRSVWISRGRAWDEATFRPDATAETIAEAVSYILG